jgi:hypothetical protein
MAWLGMRFREEDWYVAGLGLMLILGIVVGAKLNIFFLLACSVLLVVVWVVTFIYCALATPGSFAVWLLFAIPTLLIPTWFSVIVSVWGFFR